MQISTTKYGHLKYSLSTADLIAAGAVLTFDFPLDSLPPGATIYSSTIKASVAALGAATAVAQLVLNGVLIGASTDVKATTGAVNNTAASGSLAAANPLALRVTTTTNNLNALTAGSIDAVINQSNMGI